MKVLTKSRFKLGLECPNKLYFTSKKEYANKKNEDTFLEALAQGGFQVEELARMHYPDGIFINAEHFEYEKAVELTNRELGKDNVVLFEAAFLHNGLFIRTDILEKKGNKIRILEVKAKAFDPNDDQFFVGVRGGIHAGWKPYLFDLAYQKYVVHKSFPGFDISAWLMMADKSKKAQVNGLNQMFRIPKDGNPRTDIIRNVNSLDEIGESVLTEINVDGIIEDILTNKYLYHDGLIFQDAVKLFRDAYQEDKFISWDTNFTACKRCEFITTEEDEKNGLNSGFKHCFSKLKGWNNIDFKKPNAFEIWDFRSGKKLMDDDRLFLKDIDENDLKVKSEPGKISHSERQMIQVEKSRDKDDSVYYLKDELRDELSKWIFPLHFIDFETSAVALPFHKGLAPYEQIAFQFSHHQYNEDGSIQHKSEFISNTAGEFPNFEFARALKATLDKDDGTIFRFATHENTILNHIIVQLQASIEPDKNELIEFFKTITYKKDGKIYQWVGERNMVDLRTVYMDYIYNPLTGGSNSLKFVLPACLNSSEFLKQKYSKPIHDINLTSKNFDKDHVWISMDNGRVINPYKLLPNLFEGWSDEDLDNVIGEIDTIADGGAALMAYAKLQYYDMTDEERNELTRSLLKYCELDTLAMVMVYEHFRYDLIKT